MNQEPTINKLQHFCCPYLGIAKKHRFAFKVIIKYVKENKAQITNELQINGAESVLSQAEDKKNALKTVFGQTDVGLKARETLEKVANRIKEGDMDIVHGDLLPGND